VSVLQRDPRDQVRVLDEDGSVVGDVPDVDDETLVSMYREMKLARHFDTRAVSLQRQGRMGTYPPLSGQEGAQVASAHALDEEDWLFPSYREHAALHTRGFPLDRILLYWMGTERGNEAPPGVNTFPVAVPIATQTLHAVGASWASKHKGERKAFITYFGDGGSSEGDTHEAMNFAGVFDTPTVFFCNNNQWAISVPRERQTAAETIAQRADAYGFQGIQVDGMDPLAVYDVTRAAVEKAKADAPDDRRPTLIEAVQYRFGAHTTADDPTVYRDSDEVEQRKRKDPIPRLETFLRETGRLDDDDVERIEREVQQEVADAIEAAESTPRPDPEELFDHTFADRTPDIETQHESFAALRERLGDAAFRNE